ncbi:hypothetical protein [Sandaracinus amylolyticus]|uniref:Uncharacterized protein n=1 Tax=Sandaracinus amylolyticus TaxID=927083 RepID=A0A0F6SEG9_9BACT|nr:hypothetical protein [Sandaracinus amylolyticus]AKF05174.1 hypothetical protein DB32_002323 [Sandaracinus amylolyticus]
MSEYEDAIVEAMARRASLEELAAITARYREDRGLARDEALGALESARSRVRDEHNEDALLELMDRVRGWCQPGHDLF